MPQPRSLLTRTRLLVALGAVITVSAAGAAALTLDGPDPLPVQAGEATVTVPGGVGEHVNVDQMRVVAQAEGATVWEAPMKDGSGYCWITVVSSDLGASLACGGQPGDIEKQLFTFDGQRRQGGPYIAVVRLASSVRTVEIDGQPQRIEGNLLVTELPDTAKTLRVASAADERSLDLRPFVGPSPEARDLP